ncbi:hypothetical protein [Metabacillus arenae]|uniref:Uncharacterized protein n=1 Tax=Metabacillus arenae TaxID=2771434 RepID=A0A926NEU9_9BACI|nr:hypothetical protein [Metabacillus arenae]MBD1379183.1 hypothetical protein [Metabacillus arenae]
MTNQIKNLRIELAEEVMELMMEGTVYLTEEGLQYIINLKNGKEGLV